MQRVHRQAYRRAKRRFTKVVRSGIDYLRKQIARIRRTEVWIKKKIPKVGSEQRSILIDRLKKILLALKKLLTEANQLKISSN